MKKRHTTTYEFINSCREHLTNEEFIEFCEKRYYNQIRSVVDETIGNGIRLIRLAGPSGAGKTTSTHLMVDIIREKGIPAYYMSMDNWYKTLPLEALPKTPEGDYDYESPELLDVEGFREDMHELLAGNPVHLREFDFVKRVSSKSDKVIRCEDNAIVVIEGLHAINPMFDTEHESLKVYIEPNNVIIDENDDLTSSELRLCRRMHRDVVDRGMSFEDTIKKCRSVDAGQARYIEPFLNDAHIHHVDTLLMYEIFIHKNELPDMDSLKDVEVTDISKDMIPETSVLKEFYK